MKSRARKRFTTIALIAASAIGAALLPALPAAADDPAAPTTIVNDTFWKDTDGNPIFSQGGGIFDFEDPQTGELTHYWYGPRYTGAVDYYNNPTNPILTGGDTFVAVAAYSSQDLVNWNYEGDVLTRDQVDSFTDVGTGIATWVGRMGVAYVAELGKYALFSQHGIRVDGQSSSNSREFVAVSDSPIGPFIADRRLDMTEYAGSQMTTGTGDQTVFTDDDGTSYLLYSKGSGRNRIWISEIGAVDGKVDFVNTAKIYDGYGREGNSMFKYDGKYYVTASDLFGWNASRPYYLVSDNVFGPYTPANNMQKIPGGEADFGHVTQTGFYYTVKGTQQDTVIYAGDRWADFAGNGLGYNQWVPMSFDNAGTPYLNSMDQWSIDATTGQWSVGEKNNYVLNGAFEADRTTAPYADKENQPIPEIAGWTRTNPSAVWNEADKSNRVGNFNLTFYSASAFSSKIEQTIDPANFPLPDGAYTLTAQVRKAAAFKDANLYAVSGGQTFSTSLSAIPDTGASWVGVSVPVTVTGGAVTVGISASGNPYQLLRADDITLVAADAPAVDKTALRGAVESADSLAPSDYSSASWSSFGGALGTARTVLGDVAADQEAVDAMTAELRAATGALRAAVIDVAAAATKTLYAVGDSYDQGGVSVTVTYADGTTGALAPEQYSVVGFGSSVPATVTIEVLVDPALLATGSAPVTAEVELTVLQAWSPTTTYNAETTVVYDGSAWVAAWWTSSQTPGDPSGPWQESSAADDGTPLWTPSRIFIAGTEVDYQGALYTAKWWTRNQTPGDPYGPWAPAS
jgi:hypothetical protein